jgi:hypothetical protein
MSLMSRKDDVATIRMSNPGVASVRYEIQTVQGRMISSGLLTGGERTAQLPGLSRGIYFYTIKDAAAQPAHGTLWVR